MTDYADLKRLAEAALEQNHANKQDLARALQAFFEGCFPEDILALIAENDEIKYLSLDDQRRRMEAEKECDQLRADLERQTELRRQEWNRADGLRVDAERCRWSRDQAPSQFLAELPKFACTDTRNRVIDAARGGLADD